MLQSGWLINIQRSERPGSGDEESLEVALSHSQNNEAFCNVSPLGKVDK